MKFDFRNIVVTILSIIVAVLGGNQYQQFSALNDIQNDVKLVAKAVESVAHKDFTRFESE